MKRSVVFLILMLLLCSNLNSQNCNSWLFLPSTGSHVSIGDVDIAGDKLTIEALINRTQNYGGGRLFAGDIVSKHVNPTDANYLLRPNSAEITTTNGYFVTPDICEIELNKTYHVAMVYDGQVLRFYRNGFLMSQVAASGDLYQNDFPTWIGYYAAQMHNTSFIGYINEVRIWNVARSQNELQSTMRTVLPAPSITPGLVAYYNFNNLLNKQGNMAYNATSDGVVTLNNTNPTCASFVADSCSTNCTLNEDFSFKTLVCNPLEATFNTSATGYNTVRWLFGDGTESTGSTSVAHAYQAGGTYAVSLILTNATCTDTITKNLLVGAEYDNILLTRDTTLCAPGPVPLRSQPALSFCWSPATYLDNPASPNPVSTSPVDITYTYTAEVVGTNLIVNGDFSAGNTGFISGYNYTAFNTTEGEYYVSPYPQYWNSALSACGDHTDGSGNMMLVNGAPAADVGVWSQTITVTPNTNYAFSTWIQALWPPNPAQLSFSINGKDIGSQITATLPTCNWTQFYTTWNSGNTTTATIAIVNKNTQIQGNDFALDDISFAPVFIRKDSVRISFQEPKIKTIADTTICAGATVPLTTTGADTYSWSPAAFLSNPSIGNPTATPNATTRYIVTGTLASGCQGKDTVDITVFNMIRPPALRDTSICSNATIQLSATGGVSYSWFPSNTLSNPNVANPIAAPKTTTEYVVEIRDANSCIMKDTVLVSLKELPRFEATTDTVVCAGTSVTLRASGGDSYQWSPSTGLSNPNIANPVVRPTGTSTYMVQIRDNVCGYDTTINVSLSVASNPNITASKLADISCGNPTTQLIGSGAASYSWTPAVGLDDPLKSNPVVTVDSTTTFILTGTDNFGCTGKDTVTVNVAKTGMPVFMLPNAFTPNNDGRNDCFGVRKWGKVQLTRMSVYNRWGQLVFESKDPGRCWDGRFKGTMQPSGAYVYIIEAKTFCGDVVRKGIVMLLN